LGTYLLASVASLRNRADDAFLGLCAALRTLEQQPRGICQELLDRPPIGQRQRVVEPDQHGFVDLKQGQMDMEGF
jgi:hypothetical protein